MERAREILSYWFGSLTDDSVFDKNTPSVKRWFSKNEAFDREIRERFESDLLKAKDGQYYHWQSTAAGRLALVLLFDQFSRNMYRGTPQMFHFDHRAQEIAIRTIEEQLEKTLPLIERLFMYMPLMHAEDVRLQERSVQRFQSLVEDAKTKCPQNVSYYKNSLSYAQRHFDIVKRFGRFPHRNAVLNRESTREELEFLKEPGSSF